MNMETTNPRTTAIPHWTGTAHSAIFRRNFRGNRPITDETTCNS